MVGVHVVDKTQDTFGLLILTKVVAGHSQIKVRKGCFVGFRAHYKNDSSIFPFLLLYINETSSLVHKRVGDILACEICDPDGFHIFS